MREIFAIDNTAISMYKECPQKYYYAIVQGYRPAGPPAAPLAFGSAWHHYLETYERFGLAAAVREAFKYPLETTDTSRTRRTLIRGLVWYDRQFAGDIFKTLTLPNGSPALELTFRVELPVAMSAFPDIPVFYTGHIDRVVEYNGKIFAMERKHTTSYLNDNYFSRYIFSAQIMGYAFALRVNFNLETAGAVIDSTQFGVNFVRHARRIAERTEEHVSEWLADTAYWISLIDNSFLHDRWPKNTESCSKFSGCQFREVCFRRPGARQAVLDGDYKIERWDPAAIRTGEES